MPVILHGNYTPTDRMVQPFLEDYFWKRFSNFSLSFRCTAYHKALSPGRGWPVGPGVGFIPHISQLTLTASPQGEALGATAPVRQTSIFPSMGMDIETGIKTFHKPEKYPQFPQIYPHKYLSFPGFCGMIFERVTEVYHGHLTTTYNYTNSNLPKNGTSF